MKKDSIIETVHRTEDAITSLAEAALEDADLIAEAMFLTAKRKVKEPSEKADNPAN